MSKVESVSAVTLDNLLSAYSAERNSSARYTAFAVQADKEGYHGVGSLFRAVAHSEQVHATNCARLLRKFGSELDLSVQPLDVRSTVENLRASLHGEQDERDQVYPLCTEQARHDICEEAMEVFDQTGDAEAVHAMMFTTALEELEDHRERSHYFVCMDCGWVSPMIVKHCVLCNAAKDRFERIE